VGRAGDIHHQEARSVRSVPGLEPSLLEPAEELLVSLGEPGDESRMVESSDVLGVGLGNPVGEVGRGGVLGVETAD
jgi:hypothetical protein